MIQGIRNRFVMPRRPAISLFVAGMLLGASVGIAAGAIPTSDGVIVACYDSHGAVRLIDPATTAACPKGYRGPISWNQTGPQGDPGPSGEPGPPGPKGDPGVVSLASLAGTACAVGADSGGVVVAIDSSGQIAMTCDTTLSCGTQPATVAHSSWHCSNGTWRLVCDATWYDWNTVTSDGCELQADTWSDSILAPTVVGTLQPGSAASRLGNLVPAGDTDWFQVTFGAGATPRMTISTSAALSFDVYSSATTAVGLNYPGSWTGPSTGTVAVTYLFGIHAIPGTIPFGPTSSYTASWAAN